MLLLDFVLPKDSKKVVALLYPKQENKVDTYLNWIKNNHQEYECIRITEDTKNIYKNKNTYLFYSIKGFWQLYRAKYIIVASSRFINYMSSKRHICINLWHGMPIKTLGLTDNLPKSINNLYKTMGESYKTFVTSDIFKHIMASCFRANYKNIFVTGLPVTDSVMDCRSNLSLEQFFEFNMFNKIIIFLPTFKSKALSHVKQIDKDYNNIFYMDDYSNENFISFLEKNNILFIMKPHPLDENLYMNCIETLPKTKNFKIVYDGDFKKNNFDLYELLKYTDLMISDFSSITLDYLILNRPIIYLNNLTDEYSQNRGMILPDNFSIFMPGHKVRTYKDLEDKIIDSLTIDSTRALREKTIPLIHKYCDNKASERIFEIMISED